MDQTNILVVDDDLEIQGLIVEALKSFGHICRTAADGQEALNHVRDGNFDIIISDIRMPRMDGLELMAKVNEMMPEVPFIIITGYSEEYSYDQVIGAGAMDFIRKPFTLEELKAKLNRTLKERQMAESNRRLYEDQAALNDKLRTLLAVARDLTAEHDFDRLFHLIIGKVTEVMEAERTSLYIIDWERKEIWTKVAEHVDQIRLPMGEGISGRVAETGETINVPDAWQLPYFQRSFDQKHNFRTRSVLCLPVINRNGERIGVIQVINKRAGQTFNENDRFVLESLASQVAVSLENSTLVEELQLSFESFVKTLSATVDAKHPLTAGHSKRVTEYSIMIAEEIGLEAEEISVIKYAALLHDVGKIGIPDAVLLKDGPFTPEERAEMNTHPLKTHSILENFRFPKALRNVPVVASQHHEKLNGQGYPYGLKGDELSLGAKIIAVADVFDALTSHRDYPKYRKEEKLSREPMPLPKAIGILEDETGTHFESTVVSAFLRCLPQVLLRNRGEHFKPEYVDETLRSLGVEEEQLK